MHDLSPEFAHITLLLIVALSILLMLTRPRGIAEAWWVCSGALLLVALQLVPPGAAAHAVAQGTDVYLFLIGMMLVSELARAYGVFDWVAASAVSHARGSAARLFLLIYLAGTAVTIFLSNDATAVVLTPAILVAMHKATAGCDDAARRSVTLPYLFACALIANAASFVLPISNPANLVVFRDGMPPLARWLALFAVPSVLSIVATYAVLRWRFRRDLAKPIATVEKTPALSPEGRMVVLGLGVMIAVLLAASAMKLDLGLPTCLAALVLVAAVSVRARKSPLPLAKAVSWPTLALVAGLFVMVNAVESLGALGITTHWIGAARSLGAAGGTLATGMVVGLANNLVNNLPLGLIVGATVHAAGFAAPSAPALERLLASAVLIGVDLGPNLSVTGSLATILWLLALRKEKIEVTGWQFLRVGLIAMPVAMLAALGGTVAVAAITAAITR